MKIIIIISIFFALSTKNVFPSVPYVFSNSSFEFVDGSFEFLNGSSEFLDDSSVLASGSYVGNGGDTIYCRQSEENAFFGHYTLDYLLEYKNSNFELIPIENFRETQIRLNTYFNKNYKEILPLFNEFIESIRKDDINLKRRWIKQVKTKVHDENIIHRIPENCMIMVDGKLKVNLTVIRSGIFDKITYKYNEEILSFQEINNPLQYSFFMIHEWLWDITRDVRLIRKLNWIFHSKDLQNLGRREFINLVNGFNLFRVKLTPCERSKPIKHIFCNKVTTKQLQKVKKINLLNLPTDHSFRVGDFYGFSKVKHLKITHQDLNSSLHPYIFWPLYSLQSLDLCDNNLNYISNEIFRGLTKLRTLKLSLNIDGPFKNKNDINNLPKSLKTLVIKSSDLIRANSIKNMLIEKRPELEVIINNDI